MKLKLCSQSKDDNDDGGGDGDDNDNIKHFSSGNTVLSSLNT